MERDELFHYFRGGDEGEIFRSFIEARKLQIYESFL
jgi:hypothetical protein